MNTFFNRIVRAAKLDQTLYAEVEQDKDALQQAMLVVILAGIATSVGFGGGGIMAVLFGWFLFSYTTYIIGTKLLAEEETKSDFSQVLRVVGFAYAPGLLMILSILPFLRGLLLLAVQIWIFAGIVVAIRQVFSYKSTGRAIVVCFFGWILFTILLIILRSLMG